jgi:tRNA-Thr(GGU) m(6)t(6)A37 methyltransferase TsaA
MKPYELKPIGVVHSSLTDLADCPPQENEGAPEVTLEIHDAFVDGFANIEAGDRLILFTWLHKAERDVLKCHPRNNKREPEVGVFSTRSPDRPNPIGMHVVGVVDKVSPRQIRVYPLEVLDGTPVIDIKPII